ncbi:hypothetical protein ABZ697_31390 [Streptomyces albidoflavus]|uniref:hypothetical protein n=1 Tax=Streptomyces albidoflavus TaxID=1886 RepID=UPI0033D5E79C
MTTNTSSPLPKRQTTTLDAVTLACAPFAAWWDAEADRRNKLRTPEHLKALIKAQTAHNAARATERQATAQARLARKGSKNPWASARRAARTSSKAARSNRRASATALGEARANYPATIRSVAVRVHMGHSATATAAAVVLSTSADWTVWPVLTSASLVAGHVGALLAGRRRVVAEVEAGALVPTAEEQRLMDRLAPAAWAEAAERFKLTGTLSGEPLLTDRGIACSVRLDDALTLADFKGKATLVRKLAGARTGLRMDIKAGEYEDRAEILLRTRAAELPDMTWTPEKAGTIGIDTDTMEPVQIPKSRISIAATSGAGKSVLLRTILGTALVAEEPTAIVYIDAKGEESALWAHCVREAYTAEDTAAVVAEILAEGEERRDAMRAAGVATHVPTAERPRLLVVVDEGAEVIAWDTAAKKLGILSGLQSIAQTGRSRRIDLIWCTQKPTYGDGIDRLISGNLTDRIGLKTLSRVETETVMSAPDFANHQLDGAGLAYVRMPGRNSPSQAPVRVWDASDDGLPKKFAARTPWAKSLAGQSSESAPAEGRAPLRLVKSGASAEIPAPAAESPSEEIPSGLTDNQVAVLKAMRSGVTKTTEIAELTGINKGSVSKAKAALEKRGIKVA